MILSRDFVARSLSLAGVILASSCSILSPSDPGITVRNQTGSSILLLAWELQASNLIDLRPSITLVDDGPLVLEAGVARFLHPEEISGGFRPGDDLRVFVYEVLGETAEYRSTLTVRASRLRANGGCVTIRTLSSNS